MDCLRIVAILAVLVAFPAMSGATEHPVGGDRGWTMDFNYTAWAEERQFVVGDTLVFNYFRGDHNVYKVDEASFKSCAVPANVQPLISGNDVVTLATPGRKWYICGIPMHCSNAEQKLAITVQSASSIAPPPTPVSMETGAASGLMVSRFLLVLVVMMVLSLIVLV